MKTSVSMFGALLAIALVPTAVAHADKRADDFTRVVKSGLDIHISSPVRIAHATCKDLAGGNNRDDEIDQLVTDGGLTDEKAALSVGIAISAYCPQYKS